MYGNKISDLHQRHALIAVNRDSGELIWEVDANADRSGHVTPSPKTCGFTGAPIVIKTQGRGKELVLQAREHRRQLGTRSRVGALGRERRQARMAHLHDPAPRASRLGDLKDNHNAWRGGRRRRVAVRASYDPATNLLFYGTAMPS
jgi:hypothetical protein